MIRTNVHLPAPLLAKLRRKSKKTGLSVAELIRRSSEESLLSVSERLTLLQIQKIKSDILSANDVDIAAIRNFGKPKKLPRSRSKTIRFKRVIPFKARSTNT